MRLDTSSVDIQSRFIRFRTISPPPMSGEHVVWLRENTEDLLVISLPKPSLVHGKLSSSFFIRLIALQVVLGPSKLLLVELCFYPSNGDKNMSTTNPDRPLLPESEEDRRFCANLSRLLCACLLLHSCSNDLDWI